MVVGEREPRQSPSGCGVTRSWVPIPDGSDFTLSNLPYGIFTRPGREPRVGVAVGDHILALAVLAEAGLLSDDIPPGVFRRSSLNAFMTLGPEVWALTRETVTDLLSEGNSEIADAGVDQAALVPRSDCEMLLPFVVADYVDFYSSLDHASNVGRIFRPEGEPLLPNWRHLPVGYHGRAGTVVVGDTPVRRPCGQRLIDGKPQFGPSQALDFELELGFVVGTSSRPGTAVTLEEAERHVFGVVVVNDWSARDIQAWETRPLGPFLGKSFATSISPWVVPMAALAAHRAPAPIQEPRPVDYLSSSETLGLDLDLNVLVHDADGNGGLVTSGNAQTLYWTMAQQLAHMTVNGAHLRTGDLFATGTISGSTPGSEGSLLERTFGGKNPLEIGSLERRYLEDGDVVTMTGRAGAGEETVGFGGLSAAIAPASCSNRSAGS